MMEKLCEACTACNDVPLQTKPRHLYHGPPDARVLIIDTAFIGQYDEAILVAQLLFPPDFPFTYTSAIRCQLDISKIKEELDPLSEILDTCGFFTTYLASNRSLILLTREGLRQLRLQDEFSPGKMSKKEKWGYMLHIPPLSLMDESEFPLYAAKIERLIKEANLK